MAYLYRKRGKKILLANNSRPRYEFFPLLKLCRRTSRTKEAIEKRKIKWQEMLNMRLERRRKRKRQSPLLFLERAVSAVLGSRFPPAAVTSELPSPSFARPRFGKFPLLGTWLTPPPSQILPASRSPPPPLPPYGVTDHFTNLVLNSSDNVDHT